MKRKFASWVKFVYVPVKEIISFLLKMARNVCYRPCGKYSNTKNNRDSTSWNQSGRNVQGSDKEAIFRRTSCIEFHSAENVAQRNGLLDPDFGTGQILYRRPRLVRGWYLGKEPLEYRKPATPFRFSFQIKDRDAAEENDKLKYLKSKTIIYPESMTVEICSLQARPVRRQGRVGTAVSNISTAGLKENGDKVEAMRALNTERAPKVSEGPKKEDSKSTDNEAKIEIDSKKTDKLRLKGEIPRSHLRQRSPAKGKKQRMPKGDFLYGKKENSMEFGDENYLDRKKFPDCCVECFTFKESDYDIWSRIGKT